MVTGVNVYINIHIFTYLPVQMKVIAEGIIKIKISGWSVVTYI